MIILPERGLPKGKLLLPQRRGEWQQPSQRSTLYGQNFNYWRLTARTDDGHIVWRGWFDDREDADAFLYSLISGSLLYEKDLWRLPHPWWPDLNPHLTYDFVADRILTSGSAANQTDNVPSDWNSLSNRIEIIAGGGCGAAAKDNLGNCSATGGGGGAYSKAVNVTLTPGGTATYFLDRMFSGVSSGSGSPSLVNGLTNTDCWYNGATLAASSVGAKGGGGGTAASAYPIAGGAGGLASGGVGSTKYSGGNGGTAPFALNGTGGGGAAGPYGDGVNGVDATVTPQGTAGGAGDAGFGGAGGAGATNGNGHNGNNGTEAFPLGLFFGTGGSGGSSGGAATEPSTGIGSGGGAGLWGSGTGGAAGCGSGASGQASTNRGGDPVIFLSFSPVFSSWDDAPQIPYRNLSKIKMVGY